MPRPTQSPAWATTAGRRLEPTAGTKATGFVEGTRTPARVANWLTGLVADWATYLAEITAPADRTHPVRTDLPLAHEWPPTDLQWDRAAGSPFWASTLEGGTLLFPIDLPAGAILKGISVRAQQVSWDVGSRLAFNVTQTAWDGSITQVASNDLGATSPGTPATVTRTLASPITIDPQVRYALRFVSQSVGDRVWSASVTYTDPLVRRA